jgi:hypothetical protein
MPSTPHQFVTFTCCIGVSYLLHRGAFVVIYNAFGRLLEILV